MCLSVRNNNSHSYIAIGTTTDQKIILHVLIVRPDFFIHKPEMALRVRLALLDRLYYLRIY